MISMPN